LLNFPRACSNPSTSVPKVTREERGGVIPWTVAAFGPPGSRDRLPESNPSRGCKSRAEATEVDSDRPRGRLRQAAVSTSTVTRPGHSRRMCQGPQITKEVPRPAGVRPRTNFLARASLVIASRRFDPCPALLGLMPRRIPHNMPVVRAAGPQEHDACVPRCVPRKTTSTDPSSALAADRT
jgi:hypothetical protein